MQPDEKEGVVGLFDFIKDVGASILGKENDAGEIEDLVLRELGSEIRDLEVEYRDGRVKLSGVSESQAAREKAILLAGNIKGVESVDGDDLTFPQDAEPVEFYTVKRGDSLSRIARAFYGDAMRYPEIFEANLEVIKDPDLIYPGQKLRIPKRGER